MSKRHVVTLMTMALSGGGCASPPHHVPARIVSPDAATLAALQQVLAEATGRKNVRLGAYDPSMMTSVTALPSKLSPYEDRSLGKPIAFDVVLKGGDCYLVNRANKMEYGLGPLACAAVATGS
jgi:hypothetical protein